MNELINKWYIKLASLLFGLALIIFGALLQINETKKVDKNLIETATVTDITKEKAKDIIKITYKYKEKEYDGYLRNYKKPISKNDKVTIVIDKDNENIFEVYEPFSLGYILVGMGLIIILIIGTNYIHKIITNIKIKIKEKKISKEKDK